MPSLSTAPLSHLELLPISAAALRSELAGDGHLGDLLDAEITPEWPPADWEPHVLELLLRVVQDNPAMTEFHRYVVLRGERERRRVLIGSVGAFVSPGKPHEVEFGYTILPAFRRRGFATEAARLHLTWLKTRPDIHTVFAQTYPELAASVRVLEALKFEVDGEGREPGTIGFHLDLSRETGEIVKHPSLP